MVRIARREQIDVIQPDGSYKPSEVASVAVVGCNSDALGGLRVPASCRCIADKCAMWRWIGGGQKNSAGARHPVTRGFCGLAGQPGAMP